MKKIQLNIGLQKSPLGVDAAERGIFYVNFMLSFSKDCFKYKKLGKDVGWQLKVDVWTGKAA